MRMFEVLRVSEHCLVLSRNGKRELCVVKEKRELCVVVG